MAENSHSSNSEIDVHVDNSEIIEHPSHKNTTLEDIANVDNKGDPNDPKLNAADKDINKQEELIEIPQNNVEVRSQNNHMEVVDVKSPKGVIENKNDANTIRNNADEQTDNQPINGSKEVEVHNKDMGVTENNSNQAVGTENMMLEFETVAKDEKASDPIDPHSNLDNNGIVLVSSTPGPEKKTRVKIPRWQKELENLGVTDYKKENNEYDCYTDANDGVYRKYRLREGAKPDYRIPTSIPTYGDNILEPKVKACRSTSPSEDLVKCSECEQSFYTKMQLRKHIKAVHHLTYICALCNQEFMSNSDLISHKTVHDSEERSFLCYDCKMAFSDHCDYLLHTLTHATKMTVFKCPECNLTYTKPNYEVHIFTHYNKPMPCSICDKKIQGYHNLRNHINKHAIKFECVECGKVLNMKANYEAHMDIHTGVKRIQCLYCGKGFRTTQQRHVHTLIHHTNERPYPCKVCDKKFNQSSDLQWHVDRYHSNKQKEECKICKRRVWYMTAHMRVHSTNKKYVCPECGKQFPIAAGLKVHMMWVHTKEKRFVCKYCDMKFVDQPHLTRHFKSLTHKRNVYKESLKKE